MSRWLRGGWRRSDAWPKRRTSTCRDDSKTRKNGRLQGLSRSSAAEETPEKETRSSDCVSVFLYTCALCSLMKQPVLERMPITSVKPALKKDNRETNRPRSWACSARPGWARPVRTSRTPCAVTSSPFQAPRLLHLPSVSATRSRSSGRSRRSRGR